MLTTALVSPHSLHSGSTIVTYKSKQENADENDSSSTTTSSLELSIDEEDVDVAEEEEEEERDPSVKKSRLKLIDNRIIQAMSSLATPGFDPMLVTVLDLSKISESENYIFNTGKLPKWICHFTNLVELDAPKLGIIILEPWLLGLKSLQSLYLEHNQITTWPYFLLALPDLEVICLDGNPCLNKAFDKSPTLRTGYFGMAVNSKLYKVIPECIRGPEWPPASSARSGRSASVNNLGFYCGGIYTLSTKPDQSNNGLLTPLAPHVLMHRLSAPPSSESNSISTTLGVATSGRRLSNRSSPQEPVFYTSSIPEEPVSSSSSSSAASSAKTVQPRSRSMSLKQTKLIREILRDIDVLLKRNKLPRSEPIKPHVFLVGSPTDRVNHLLVSKSSSMQTLTALECYRFLCELVQEEENYLNELQIVCQEFFESKIKPTAVSNYLRLIFTGFPAMLSIHTRHIMPGLRKLCQAALFVYQIVSARDSRAKNANATYTRYEKKLVSDTVLQAVASLCTAVRRVQLAFESYTRNLWRTEHILDLSHSITRLYRDNELAAYVKSQMQKVGGLGGPLGASLMGHPPSSFPIDSSLKALSNILRTPASPSAVSDQYNDVSSDNVAASAATNPAYHSGFDLPKRPPQMHRRSNITHNATTMYHHTGSSPSPNLSSKSTPAASSNSSSSERRKMSKSRWLRDHSLHSWIEEYLRKPSNKMKWHPAEFIYLPMVRLVRYERFFTSFARSDNRYEPILRIFRRMRRKAATDVQEDRRKVRSNVLTHKFKTSPHYFNHYRWDALLTVNSRGYFESGILEKNTSDVIDEDGRPVSFIRETFSSYRSRILRLVCCGLHILMWDEAFEHFIGKIEKKSLIALPLEYTGAATSATNTEVRLVFPDLSETCVVEVRDFRANYPTTLDDKREFLEACQCEHKILL